MIHVETVVWLVVLVMLGGLVWEAWQTVRRVNQVMEEELRQKREQRKAALPRPDDPRQKFAPRTILR